MKSYMFMILMCLTSVLCYGKDNEVIITRKYTSSESNIIPQKTDQFQVQNLALSSKEEVKEIADAITNDLHRGVTVLDGKGWYTKNEVNVVMVITRKTDLSVFLKYINAIDPDAFVSVSSGTGVYGKGFDTMKFSKKRK